MPHYCVTFNLRDDCTVEQFEEKARELVSKYEDFFLTREVGTRNGFHWHGLISMPQKEAAARMFLKRHFDYTGVDAAGKMYSLKLWDGDGGWLRYCCKGPNNTAGEVPVVVINSMGRDCRRLNEDFWSSQLERIQENAAKKAAIRRSRIPARREFIDFAFTEGFEEKEDLLRLLQSFLVEKGRSGEPLFHSETQLQQWCHAAWLKKFSVRASMDMVARVRDRFL